MEQYYAVYLDDYSTPGFCSVIKEYFGTVRDIRNFIKALDKTAALKQPAKPSEDLKKVSRVQSIPWLMYSTASSNRLMFLPKIRSVSEKRNGLSRTHTGFRMRCALIRRSSPA